MELKKIIQKEYDNIAGLVVLKDGKLVFEFYNDGYNLNDTVHIASVTKSIISALIGIAIKKNAIRSIDQKVIDFFPGYKIKRGEKTMQEVTIRNLLTMTAPYKYEPYTKVYSSRNWTKAVLDILGGRGKIGEFKYTTVGLHILSGIIVNATGQTLLDFANGNLFTPLGIKATHNTKINNRQDYLDFIKGKKVSGWIVDPTGVNTAGWGLTLTTLDMAKIGQLYLNNGKWENNEIIPSTWIEESTDIQSKFGVLPYGYLWWIVMDKNRKCYAALGDGGNAIYVDPQKNTVVAISSEFMPRAKDRIELIKKYITPQLG